MLETLVAHYGYAAIFVGAVIEGETVLLVAAVLVQQGLMDFKYMLLVSAMGAFTGDQFFFVLGRRKGADLFRRHPAWRRKMDKAERLLKRYRGVVTLFYRFIYGMRAVIPFLLGSGRCRVRDFALLSAISALAWAALIGTGGYFLGATFAQLIHQGRSLQMGGMLGIVLLVIIFVGIRWRQRRSDDAHR